MFKYDFKLQAGDFNVGTVYLPNETATDIPVIIYCHGWGGNRSITKPIQVLCDTAMEAGIALVTFDFFGCGETGGDYSQMTYTRWKNNLSDILSWVEAQAFSNNGKIGCYAFSSGSTAALRMASEDERLSFIVSVGTCISSHIGMGSGGPAKILADNMDKLLSGGTASIFGVDFKIDFYLDTISNAPIHVMDKIKCPVLFLQGTADNPFRCADAVMAYELMQKSGSSNKTAYMPIEGGTHGLDNVAEEAIDRAFSWMMEIYKS